MSKRRERPSVVSPRRPLLSFLPFSESAAAASAAVRTQLQAKGRRESTAAADLFQVRCARSAEKKTKVIYICAALYRPIRICEIRGEDTCAYMCFTAS